MKKIGLPFALIALVTLLLPSLVKADDDFKFSGSVLVVGGSLTGVTPTLFVNSGCGADNQKCSCDYDIGSEMLTMTGQGTSGTSTGLDFTCNWQISTTYGSCMIKWRIDIPHSGDNGMNFVTTSGCSDLGNTFTPKVACSGHDFNTNTAVKMNGNQSGGSTGQIDKGSCGD